MATRIVHDFVLVGWVVHENKNKNDKALVVVVVACSFPHQSLFVFFVMSARALIGAPVFLFEVLLFRSSMCGGVSELQIVGITKKTRQETAGALQHLLL